MVNVSPYLINSAGTPLTRSALLFLSVLIVFPTFSNAGLSVIGSSAVICIEFTVFTGLITNKFM